MKDIQEIMKEMNKASDKKAITVAQAIPGLSPLACNCTDACAVGGLTACGTTNTTVTAPVCTITAPRNFVFDTTGVSTIAYSLTDLRAIVEPCSCSGSGATVFAVRVIGSIPFTVNVPLLGTATNCTAGFIPGETAPIPGFTPTVYACCCCGNATVDNILGFACTPELAASLVALINALLLNCTFITSTLSVAFNGDNTVATATATFILPDLCTNPPA